MDNNFTNLLSSQNTSNYEEDYNNLNQSYTPDQSYYPNQPYYSSLPNIQNNLNQMHYTQNEVQCTQISPSPSNNKGKSKKKRGENIPWKEEEDEALMSAWGIVSTNAILGKNQQEQIRWGNVLALFKKSREGNEADIHDRSQEGLRGRFNIISKNASKWVGYYKEVLSLPHKSGTNDADVENEVQKLYAAENKGVIYDRVSLWKNILSQYPKWSLNKVHVNFNEEILSQSGGSSKRSRNESDDTMYVATSETVPETPPSVNLPKQPRRPEGRDAAKKKRNGKSVCSQSSMNPQLSEQLSSMQIVREQGNLVMSSKLSFNKERLNWEKEKMKELKENEIRRSEMQILNTMMGRQELTTEEDNVKVYLMKKYFPGM